MTTQTTDLVRDGYEALSRGDVQPILGMLDDQIEWNEAEHVTYWPGGAFTGPDAVLEGVFARIADDFDGFRVDVERISELGSTILVEARYRGTVRSTGRQLDAQVAHVWEFRDGKAVRWQQYTDTWQFAEVTQVAAPR
ncbi:MAG TPA: nuclear transport factor 2 family protein [Nocardioidaceae bacterium]|nr:nuclear transport factor 2 family protein [Nocardioidaceae bacterium]